MRRYLRTVILENPFCRMIILLPFVHRSLMAQPLPDQATHME